MDRTTVPLTVVVLTKDEEANIERCLKTVAGWASQVVIVDSDSSDRTLEIARQYTDEVYVNPFENHVRQWQWALDNVSFENDWVLALDADHEVLPELRNEIAAAIGGGRAETGFYISRQFIFRGRHMRHGGIYPNHRLVLFRRDDVFLDVADVNDQHFYVHGSTGTLKGEIREENEKDRSVRFWVEKQIRAATSQAREEVQQRDRAAAPPVKPTPFGHRNQRVLWLKRRWLRLPLYWRSVGYFLFRYFVRFGFLDGRPGFVYHLTQALVYRVMLDAMVEEELERERG